MQKIHSECEARIAIVWVSGHDVSTRPQAGQVDKSRSTLRSGKTGESARDRQMHDKVLESDRFPDAIFSPDHVKGRMARSGESQVEVHGSLRIHGEEHEMTIPVRGQSQCGQRPGGG
jgi:polyisoprenoid-binding protein YceI